MWFWLISAVFVAKSLALMATDTSREFVKLDNTTADGSGRVVGGQLWDYIDRIPHQAYVRVAHSCKLARNATDTTDCKYSSCGGSIIHRQYILTAAHCLYARKKNVPGLNLQKKNIRLRGRNVWVKVGTANSEDGGQEFRGKRTIIHKFKGSLMIDFAMIKLNASITLGSKGRAPQLIEVPKNDSDWTEKWNGGFCWITGWGDIERRPYWQSPSDAGTNGLERTPRRTVLRKADIDILTNDECKNMLKNFDDPPHNHQANETKIQESESKVNDYIICAYAKDGGKRDVCEGDSGGPLTCFEKGSGKQILAGVVRSGFGCGSPNLPGLYTRAPKLRGWITKLIKKYSPNDTAPFP